MVQANKRSVFLGSLDAEIGIDRIVKMLNPPQFLYAIGQRQLAFRPGTVLAKPDGSIFAAPAVVDIDFAPAAGKDYYVHVDGGGILISPATITDDSAILVGGFHTLCADAGTGLTYSENGVDTPHPLSGCVAGDILPASVWCLNHCPHSEPEGMVYIPTLDFWCDIYLASGTGLDTTSAYQGVITRDRQIGDFIEDFMLVKKTLLDDTEFTAAMLGSNEETSGSLEAYTDAIKNGAGGRTDKGGRRMISIYGVEEGCGLLWQFLREITADGMGVWRKQSGGKGEYYQCGCVIAGGDWSDGAYCGSRARYATNARSAAFTNVGGRGRSRHVGS